MKKHPRNLSRDRLLSDLERERLANRTEEKYATVRATNDARVMKKLSAWLKEIEDVKLIVRNLPKEDIQKAAGDIAVIDLMFSAIQIMIAKGYRPIVGQIGHPDDWRVVIKEAPMNEDHIRVSPTDEDIFRSANLTWHMMGLESMLEPENNPVSRIIKYTLSGNNPIMAEILKEHPNTVNDIEKGKNRIAEASVAMSSKKRNIE